MKSDVQNKVPAETPTYLLGLRLTATGKGVEVPAYHIDGDWLEWKICDLFTLHITTGANGYGIIEVNDGMFRMNPYVEEMETVILQIADGESCFITKKGPFGRYISGFYSVEEYNEKRRKLRFGFGIEVWSSNGILD